MSALVRLVAPLFLGAATLTVAPAAHAQGDPSPWAPWVGCWDLVPRDNAPAVSERVCVLPTGTPDAVDLVSIAGDRVASRQRLQASESEREVRQGDCSGVEQVQAAGARVYLRTRMRCGGETRLVNSVMAMTRDGDWLDVRGVAFGSNVGVRALRYREAPASAELPSEVVAALEGRPRGMHPARLAASGPVQLSDVVEASRHLEIGVLQTWLAERRQGFGLDAQRLLALEGAGVDPSVIDIMVALSYPEVFALDRTALGDPPPDTRGEMRGGDFGGGYWDEGFGYDPYGYGYGRGLGWFSGRRPIVVVQRPSDEAEREQGQVVKGRGYVSGRNGSSGGARSGGSSGGSSSGTAGRASSDGEKSSTSTGRKAKPRPGA